MSIDYKREFILDAKFVKGTGFLEKAHYGDGALALVFHYSDGDGLDTLSTNLVGHGLVAPPDHVYVKSYSEHEGLAETMADAGIAEQVGEPVTFGPFDTSAVLMKVLV